jgi:hypothetical protein
VDELADVGLVFDDEDALHGVSGTGGMAAQAGLAWIQVTCAVTKR